MTLNDLKGQTLTDVQIEDNVVKLTFESGHWLKFDWAALWCGQHEASHIAPEMKQFLAEMKRRRVAQEARAQA